MKNIECFCSSFLFLTNALLAYKYKYFNYSYAFIFLVITSLIHHFYYTKFTRNLDRIAILIVFYLTLLLIYDKKIKLVVNLYIGLCFFIYFYLYLYLYGYFTNQYSFDTNYRKSCLWHSLLHLISCIGFNLIILS